MQDPERGAVVGRMVGEGSKMRPQDFQVFAPVAMAGLGRLPETIEQRSLRFRLKRRKPGEEVAKFRRREIGPEAEQLPRPARVMVHAPPRGPRAGAARASR